MKSVLFALSLIALVSGEAYAKPRRNYTYSMPTVRSSSSVTSSYTSGMGHGSDQERCQAEADYMAANGIMGHVGGTIGRFEGVGYGSSPTCNTCTPGGGMTRTGDASALGRNGMWYRVRSWR